MIRRGRPKPQRAEQLVNTRIPELRYGPGRTKSSALHNIKFVGSLRKWTTFEQEVRNAIQRQDWAGHDDLLAPAPYVRPARYDLAIEHVCVGDETGVQGRFQQNIGQVMSAVFGSQGYNLIFSDFKASGRAYGRTPDVVIMDSDGSNKAVGEMKTDWIPEHQVDKFLLKGQREKFREAVGQVAEYMKDLGVKYGFFSTYLHHVFFKQEQDSNGQWRLFYSPVIQDIPGDSASSLTVRQCFFFLGAAGDQAQEEDNQTPDDQWCRAPVKTRR